MSRVIFAWWNLNGTTYHELPGWERPQGNPDHFRMTPTFCWMLVQENSGHPQASVSHCPMFEHSFSKTEKPITRLAFREQETRILFFHELIQTKTCFHVKSRTCPPQSRSLPSILAPRTNLKMYLVNTLARQTLEQATKHHSESSWTLTLTKRIT